MKKGFTLAEVLITLAIIGIVAAITIPTLMADVNQKAFDNQRKTLHARLANALTAMDRLSGYGIYDDSDEENIKDTAAESFVVDGLSKVYKIKNICTFDKKDKCGIAEEFTTFQGESRVYPANLKKLFPGTGISEVEPIVFETNNGESVIMYYNPNCKNKQGLNSDLNNNMSLMCANFIYDLNGPKAPNMMGKDMGFITAYYKDEPVVVAPMVDDKSTSITDRETSYDAADKCAELGDDYRLPTKEEVLSIMANRMNDHSTPNISMSSEIIWTSEITKPGTGSDAFAYLIDGNGSTGGIIRNIKRESQQDILCVKR